jgi:YD repeat-containing protein
LVLLLALAPLPARAQTPPIFYVYDDLNRLSAVVDQQGDAATYTYDTVGNILRIDRFDAAAIPGAVGITLVSSGDGQGGAEIQIFGKGFSTVPGSNVVTINGVTAIVTAAAANRLVIIAPAGTAGPVVVTTPSGTATSSQSIRVRGTLTVTPSTAAVVAGGQAQFIAIQVTTPTTNVRWAVNGIPSGTASTGVISASGLYTAPPAVPSQPAVTITATDPDDATLTASALVTIIPSQPIFLASHGVSFNVAPSTTSAEFVYGAVSVAVAPVITSISPPIGSPGRTLSITVTGAGFAGATSLAVLLNNAIDPNVFVADVVVDGSGTHLTASLTVASGAAIGPRVLRVVTPAGSSMRIGTGPDLFTVQ